MKKMATHRYTLEAVNLITGDDNLDDINASDLEDTESKDGDVEEAYYISSTGEAELVTHTLLQSRAVCEEDTDEPALSDSLLLLDEDLSESDETEPDEECNGMEVETNEASGNSNSEDDDHPCPLRVKSRFHTHHQQLEVVVQVEVGGGEDDGGQEEGEEDKGGEEEGEKGGEGEEGLAEAP